MLDIIIKNAILFTMADSGVGMIPNGAAGIKGNRIEVVDDSVFVTKSYNAKQVIDAGGKVLMPGFINTHCHSQYGVMCRGILTDLEFYLEQGLAGYLDTLDIEKETVSCRAHLLEGVKHGITTFGDIGSHYDILSGVHDAFGVRARIGEQIREMQWDISEFLNGDYVFDRKYAQPGIDAMFRILDKYGTDPNERISAMVSFQALDYVSEELMTELREVAGKRNAMIHTHLAQSPYEVEQSIRRFGVRPVEAFEKLGFLSSNTLAAHLVYNTREENRKAAESGMRMACCPFSWCEVGISPPTAQYLHFGGTVGLGSDEATYTGINPMQDMKTGYLNANIDAYHNDVPTIPMSRVLRLQTIDAAKALGMEKQIGSLEPGKFADMILLNPNTINMMPVLLKPLTNLPQNIVSTATGNEIETVIIDGKMIMENHELKTVDEKQILEDTQRLGQEAAESAAQYYEKLARSEVLDRQKWFEQ